MDEFVNAAGAWLTRCRLGMIVAALALPACAETLRDPTRPPSVFEMGPAGSAQPAEAEPRLQSVLISPTRRIAVISGKTVAVGDSFGAGEVVRISENEVVIRSGGANRTLKLYAGAVGKTAPGGKLAATAGSTEKTRER